MKDNVSKYYNLPELWNRPPMKHQIEIIELIKSKIPSDVSSILDIGSGNGIITNQLKYPRVCAVDISEEALKYVQTEKKIGSIDQLPFKDNEFDLLLV
ncbi:class I SAM-dependent methyltransferase, partial [Paenibacillus sp. TAF58]